MVSLQFGGFEEEHHALAGLFSGIIAGIGGGAVTNDASTDDSGTTPPPDIPVNPPMVTPPDQTGPVPHVGDTYPYTDEFGNPQTLILQPDGKWQRDSDGHTVDIDRLQQAIKEAKEGRDFIHSDLQKQIAADTNKAASDDKALHDFQDHLHDETNQFWKKYHEDENEFNSWEAEHELSKSEGFEKLMNAY